LRGHFEAEERGREGRDRKKESDGRDERKRPQNKFLVIP